MKRICLALAFALALATAATAQTRAENEQEGCEILWPAAECEKIIPWAKGVGEDACIDRTLQAIRPSVRKTPGTWTLVFKACKMIIEGQSEELFDEIMTKVCAKSHDPRTINDCRAMRYLKD
jgi:hypothetical protein